MNQELAPRHDYPISDDITLHPRHLPGQSIAFWNGWSDAVESVGVVDIRLQCGTPEYKLSNVPGKGTCWVSFAAAHAEADNVISRGVTA